MTRLTLRILCLISIAILLTQCAFALKEVGPEMSVIFVANGKNLELTVDMEGVPKDTSRSFVLSFGGFQLTNCHAYQLDDQEYRFSFKTHGSQTCTITQKLTKIVIDDQRISFKPKSDCPEPIDTLYGIEYEGDEATGFRLKVKMAGSKPDGFHLYGREVYSPPNKDTAPSPVRLIVIIAGGSLLVLLIIGAVVGFCVHRCHKKKKLREKRATEAAEAKKVAEAQQEAARLEEEKKKPIKAVDDEGKPVTEILPTTDAYNDPQKNWPGPNVDLLWPERVVL